MAQNNPFSSEIHFEYGVTTPLSPFVRRFVANNPGPLTFKGTNIYILGHGKVTLIDTGPDDETHVEALLKALPGEQITRIFLTHTHKDHSGALASLQARTGAKTYGFRLGDVERGAYQQKAGAGLVSSFADRDFTPDHALDDGDQVQGEGWSLRAVHTPGHAPDHICYFLPEEKALFTGDHVMPWSTTVIAPPEGNMKDYMASLDQLAKRDDEIYFPGHGGRVRAPKKLLRAYVLHRQWREKSILELANKGKESVDQIVPVLYRDVDDDIKPAAALSVLAHLLFLVSKDKLQSKGEGFETRFSPVNSPG